MEKIIHFIMKNIKFSKLIVTIFLLTFRLSLKEQTIRSFLHDIVYNHISYEIVCIIFQIAIIGLFVSFILAIFLNGIYYYKADKFFEINKEAIKIPPEVLKYASLSHQCEQGVGNLLFVLWFLILIISLSDLYTGIINLISISILKDFIVLFFIALVPFIAYKYKISCKRKYF